MNDKPGRQQLSGYEQAIATLRLAQLGRGPSQNALAERIGTSKSSIQHWLAGRREPLASSLFALANALDYDLALIPREDTP